MRPQRHAGVLADNLSHVGRRLNHAAYLLDIAVLTGNVAFHHLLAVHPSLLDAVGLMVRENRQVFVSQLVERRESREEVDHRRSRSILEDGNALATILELLPRSGVRHPVRTENLHRVIDAHSRLTTHTLAFLGRVTAHVRQQLNEVGIVDHRVVQQQFLL